MREVDMEREVEREEKKSQWKSRGCIKNTAHDWRFVMNVNITVMKR